MSKTDLSFIRGKRARWLVLLLIASLPLLGWWSYGLFDLDEGFYAAVTGSMIRHHEWITPLYNGHPWFEKPILIYWLAKPAVMMFGQDFGPRFPSVLATIATYAVVAWFTRRRVGPMAAVMSLFILGSSVLVVSVGRMMMTDAPLTFFFTCAMLAYWESLVGDARWKLVTAACLGLAVLAKGPVGIILFVLIAGWTAWSFRRGKANHLTRGNNPLIWPFGALILFVIIAAWYVPAYIANGQTFVQKFLIDQNIGRFTGGDQAHTLPLWKSFWFYIPILLAGMFPWILWLPSAWPKRNLEPISDSVMLGKYLAGWAAIIFIFFTLSGAKLAHYVLPCCPPIAILVGSHLADKWLSLQRKQVAQKLMLAVGWLLASWIIVQIGFEFWYVKSGQAEAHAFARYIRKANDGSEVVTFQLPRRNKSRGTGGTQIQETSLPSMSFYTDQDIVEADSWQTVEAMPANSWIFTRVGRIPSDTAERPQITTVKAGNFYQVLQRK